VTRQSKWLISAELILSILIILTLILQPDGGWDALPIVCIYRPILQIILIFVLIFHFVTVLRKRNGSIGRFLLKLIYFLGIVLLHISTFIFQNEFIYAQEKIYFTLNANWFEQVAIIAPNLSHCITPSEFSCWETVSLPEANRRENYPISVASYRESFVIIVSVKSSVYNYVHLSGQTMLPQFSLGDYKNVGCDYRLSETWFLCAIGP
jgi:hypothetical protein